MVAHAPHPDILEQGLHEGCPRCEEHAEHPELNLDVENIYRLRNGGIYSDLDRIAFENLRRYFGDPE
jgi:hypothetical protein